MGAGNEPYVVGAAFAMEANETSDLIIGNKGVYMLQVTAKNIVNDLEDYTSFANTLAQLGARKSSSFGYGCFRVFCNDY